MKRRTVKILTGTLGGMVKEYEVPAIAVCGALCVTRRYERNALFVPPDPIRGGGYRVTHIPTGLSVFRDEFYVTKERAVATMKKLAALDGWEAAEVKKNKALKTAVRDIEAEMEKKD